MSLIQHELNEVRKLCENCIGNSKLIVCMENMVRVEINNTELRKLIVCFQFPTDYPTTPILFELKSKTFSDKFLKKLSSILEVEAKKILGKPQILPLLKFLHFFLEENTLSICYDEISNIKLLLSDKDEIKVKQKLSSLSLKVTEGLYFIKVKFSIPIDYPNKAVSIQDCLSNFPPLLLRFVVGQSNELARQCIEPPAARLVKSSNKSVRVVKNNQPFTPTPSLEKVASFIIRTVKSIPDQKCQGCSNDCLPINPEEAEKDESADKHIERLYCGHLLHLRCLINYLKTPPFKGKSCQICNEKIYHDKWKISERLAEDRWAHQQARERELKEVSEFFD